MPRPRIPIDEQKLLEECKSGVTVTYLVSLFGTNRETMRKRIHEYVSSGKLVWAEPCRKGHAGILKTA